MEIFFFCLTVLQTRRNYELREGMLRSFAQWSETLKPTLVKAAREVPFPTLQYA